MSNFEFPTSSSTLVFSNGGIATVSERTRASVADSRYVVRVSTENSRFDSTEHDKISE